MCRCVYLWILIPCLAVFAAFILTIDHWSESGAATPCLGLIEVGRPVFLPRPQNANWRQLFCLWGAFSAEVYPPHPEFVVDVRKDMRLLVELRGKVLAGTDYSVTTAYRCYYTSPVVLSCNTPLFVPQSAQITADERQEIDKKDRFYVWVTDSLATAGIVIVLSIIALVCGSGCISVLDNVWYLFH